MATLGGREMTRKGLMMHSNLQSVGCAAPSAHLSITSSMIQCATVLGEHPISLDTPIMGEDFITVTGINELRNQ